MVGPLKGGTHKKKYLLVMVDKFTKWIEVIPTKQANESVIISFLENNILSRFGCPMKIITDNAKAFKSKKMINFCHQYHITLGNSSTYYPQGNGLFESTNKSIVRIIENVSRRRTIRLF